MNIIKILVILILIYFVYRLVRIFSSRRMVESRERTQAGARSGGEDLVQDPCCGVYVPKSQSYSRQIEGQTLYFCSRECCDNYLERKK
ncbi:MAG TPA: hypothetical protein PK090_03510 [Smithellaceae bacterium]|nr:hypothetical protein [Smithellaceae bacterium]